MKVIGTVTRVQERDRGKVIWIEGLSLLLGEGIEAPSPGTEILGTVYTFWKGKRPVMFLIGWREHDGFRP